MPPETMTSTVPLSMLRPGQTALVTESHLSREDAALLCAMGLCMNAHIRLCRAGEPCVVAVGSMAGGGCSCGGHCRIGLARGLAEQIFVTVLA